MQDLAHVEDFVEAYRSKERICVFTGAGVSFTQDERYGAPGWRQLLHDILVELLRKSGNEDADGIFYILESKNKDLWDLASAVKARAHTRKDFHDAFRTAVLRENESVDSYGRLKIGNLRGATTLNGIVAFCSQVREIRKHPCFRVSPKIEAVLTANYDWFLESGATAMHQAGLFKPMTRPSSDLGRNDLPVYHIHGYLPFGKTKKGISKRRQPKATSVRPTEPLVLDRETYERAYSPGSWTLEVLNRYLCNYTTVFIGFSFEDQYFLNALRRFAQRPQAPTHFALMHAHEKRPAGILDEIRRAGVRPILYDDHGKVPSILERVYLSVFQNRQIAIARKGVGVELVNPADVWKMLISGKQWKVTSREGGSDQGK